MITTGEVVSTIKPLGEWVRSLKKRKSNQRFVEDALRCAYSDQRNPEGTSKVDAWVTMKLGPIEDRTDPRFIELRTALQAFAGARRLEGSPVDGADCTLLLDALYDAVR